jgi:hypothetical protein
MMLQKGDLVKCPQNGKICILLSDPEAYHRELHTKRYFAELWDIKEGKKYIDYVDFDAYVKVEGKGKQ